MTTSDFRGLDKGLPIVAIDPGTTLSAFVMWDGSKILTKGKTPNEMLLDDLKHIPIVQGRGPQLVIEMIGHYGSGMAVGKEVFETCVWIGRYVEAWKQHSGEDALLVKRTTVKMHLCGIARAKDANVRQALIDRLGAPGKKANPGVTYGVSNDVWQALGLAVTAFDLAGRKAA